MLRYALPFVVFAAGTVFASGQTLSPPPSGAPLFTLQGKGAQVYRCTATGWVLDHPDAKLKDKAGKVVGHHAAGPAWYSKDGSSVTGKAIEHQASPDPQSVAWLALEAVSHAGAGVMTEVETIRRTDTHGGMAPAGGCDATHPGKLLRVPYSATYTFYGK